MDIYTMSIYLGITGLFCIIFSFLTGMRIVKINYKYKFHKRIGIVGFIAAIIHGFIMLYFYLFI